MFVINAVEITNVRGCTKPIFESVEVEYHDNIIDATTNMNYFSGLFGKHYRFYITQKK